MSDDNTQSLESLIYYTINDFKWGGYKDLLTLEGYYIYRGQKWKSLIVLLYDTFLYVAFTLKISFYHDVFFGFVWFKTLEYYMHSTLRHTRWIYHFITYSYVKRTFLHVW